MESGRWNETLDASHAQISKLLKLAAIMASISAACAYSTLTNLARLLILLLQCMSILGPVSAKTGVV